MEDIKLGVVESRFADIIWENEPLSSRTLVELCNKELAWKKSTTYTVLKKLCEKGLFKNDNSIVSSIISRDEFFSMQSENFVNETFEGSLPAFFAAFTKRKNISEAELSEIRRMIDNYGKN
ncbi:MAG: BlaI/MecI/CopY family transcriptional regulator [Lachnospiraceae bacterium]|nr:BlaI/MecI/CopY family transcriptional regulator [Lachnospiraceae bacterium]